MTIADVNNLPTITLNVTGREGTGSSVKVINQESKEIIEESTFTYTQGSTLTFDITDSEFLSSIDSDTTLSVILIESGVPLYRDIVRFSGEMNTAADYTQYNNNDDYFIYDSDAT